MRRIFIIILITIVNNNILSVNVKLKDIAGIGGFKTHQLIGYGIVVGLSGTGDRGKAMVTVNSVVNMLQKLGVRIPLNMIETRNCAAVIVTANLPPVVRIGEKIDVNIASIGNAKSLYGGILLMTPLKAGNGEVYAIAQGPINVGGHNFEINNNKVMKNSPLTAYITDGGIIQKNLDTDILDSDNITLFLNSINFNLATKIANKINTLFGENIAISNDGKNIKIKIPDIYKDKKAEFLAKINDIEIEDNGEPIIVLDERTGTIIVGGDVKVHNVSISHGNLHISVSSKNIISQPNSFSGGKTISAIDSKITVKEDKASFTSLAGNTTVDNVIKSLNSLGVSAEDIISIISDMKVAGAIKGKVIVK